MDIKGIITSIVEKKLKKGDDDPCWDGYVKLGTKMKDGKEVPNCVPKESVELDEISNRLVQKVRDRAAERIAGGVGKTTKDPKTGLFKYVPPTEDEKALAQKGVKSFTATRRAIERQKKESTDLSERVELSHDRYLRSHGKKARGSGMWMFTSKDMGEPSEDEMVTVSGDLSTAAKEAAKKLSVKRVYVMESVELDEQTHKFSIYKNPKGYGIAQWVNYTWWDHSHNSKKYYKTAAEAKKYIEKVWGKGHKIEVNESVELDEALAKNYSGMLGSFMKNVERAEQAKKKGDTEKMQMHLNQARNRLMGMKSADIGKLKTSDHYDKYKQMKESVELDEAKTDAYHQHMLKALGKSKLPKNHSFTSAIADNGDFIVRDGGGRIVGRIPKGEHDLKESTELTEDAHNDLNDAIIDFQRKLMRMTRQLDPAIAKEVKKIDKDLDDLRTGPLFKIRPGR